MKNELHTKYYLPQKDAKTHIHLKSTKQKQPDTNTSPNQNKQYTEFPLEQWGDLNEGSKISQALLLGNDLRNRLTVPYSNYTNIFAIELRIFQFEFKF